MAKERVTSWGRGDRDLLVELRTEMVSVKEAIQGLTDTTRTRVDDHENRLRFIERYMWGAIGILGFVQVAFNFLK